MLKEALPLPKKVLEAPQSAKEFQLGLSLECAAKTWFL